jgi:hypothetical protein
MGLFLAAENKSVKRDRDIDIEKLRHQSAIRRFLKIRGLIVKGEF